MERIEEVRQKLNQRKLLVLLFNWRIVTQQDLLIKPLWLNAQQKQLRMLVQFYLNLLETSCFQFVTQTSCLKVTRMSVALVGKSLVTKNEKIASFLSSFFKF